MKNKPELKTQYENFIGGEWITPVKAGYKAFETLDNGKAIRDTI